MSQGQLDLLKPLFTESNNNQKLMLEYEKFQDLQLKLQRVQQQYEQQLHSVEESKVKDMEDITRLNEAKLKEKMMMLTQVMITTDVIVLPVWWNGDKVTYKQEIQWKKWL